MSNQRTHDTLPAGDFMAGLASALGVDLEAIRNAPPVDREARSARLIAEQRDAARKLAYESDIGEDYRATDWEHPHIAPFRAACEAIRGWKTQPRGILATGPSGRGKTRAIADLYRRLMFEDGVTVRYVKAVRWFARLNEEGKGAYGRDDARRWVENEAKAPVYILDDIGQQAVISARAEWSEGWLFHFLDLRRDNRLPLIATTNLTADEIAGSGRIRSDPLLTRLLDLCEVVAFETPAEIAARKAAKRPSAS